jgi:hypothetical protein
MTRLKRTECLQKIISKYGSSKSLPCRICGEPVAVLGSLYRRARRFHERQLENGRAGLDHRKLVACPPPSECYTTWQKQLDDRVVQTRPKAKKQTPEGELE